MFLSLSLTALIDDVNGLEPYILHWQVIRYAGSNSCSTTLKLTKLTFSQRLTVTFAAPIVTCYQWTCQISDSARSDALHPHRGLHVLIGLMRCLCISVISEWLIAVDPARVHRAHSSMCLLPPMDSSVSVTEPEDTPQLTPPALLALSTASSRVRNATAGRPCTTGAVGVWEGGGRPRRCSEPSDVPHRSHVRSDFTRCKRRVIPPSRATCESAALR